MAAQVIDARRGHRQDTFDLRNEIIPDDAPHRPHTDGSSHASDEEHSVLEDDSSNEDRDGEYMDEDDGSSSLSIPNESIDFDLVYSLHNFAATVEGQASVVKGDSLFLMDDSNSYWWLVRVLTTQEVGYIPAENIETPFERLARLNKHRNVDLASATQEELQEDVQTSRDRIRGVISPRNGQGTSPATERKSVVFTGSSIYNYPPALWGDEEMDEDDEWDDEEGEYEGEYEEEEEPQSAVIQSGGLEGMEPDDGMSWEGTAVEEERARAAAASVAASPASPASPAATATAPTIIVPTTLRSAGSQPVLSPISTSPQQPLGLASTLRQQTSRERLQAANESPAQTSPASPSPSSPVASVSPSSAASTVRTFIDPATAGETRKVIVTPSIAREAARQSLLQETVKRAREEEEETSRKRKQNELAQPVSSATVNKATSSVDVGKSAPPSGGKLRKGRESPAQDDDGGKEKKKKSGVFGGLFGRGKKDKSKDKMSEAVEGVRNSEDSARSGSIHGQYTSSPPETGPAPPTSPPGTAMRARDSRNSTDPRRSNAGSTPTPGQVPSAQGPPPSVSQHSLKMQQIDQQQQQLYQQYLKSSPASHPEGPSYGLQSAASVMPNNGSGLTPGFRTQGGRPGSLILSPTGLDGQGVPELSVIRVFAGPNLHTEATFKTVLLNASTTSSDLIRQAMQRFRLAAGEDASDYYLEIKQVEGSSAVLLPQERPLGVFENLVEAAQLEVPRVKRSSMGSISSVSSTLSMHPAIKKLSMNDFTDDSAVKFYLNRRSSGNANQSVDEEEETTIRLSTTEDSDIASPTSPSLTLTTAGGTNVTPERFSSPSSRFALQVFILPDDLPDGMVFDPHTEAILPKSTLRDRSLVNAAASPGVSQTQRRKVLQFPKNTTVAEVIELALERFGIAEGVVDGGDEVEDKLAKRMSLARVRYGLAVQVDGQERQLQPSSKILDAFPRPPIFKAVERRSGEKRRSVDSAMLLGVGEDVRPDDPVFMLRRAVGFRNSGKSRMSAPLDEIALQHLHQREAAPPSPGAPGADEGKSMQQQQQMSRQELIAAQRAASRANQRAILSSQSNSERGVDVLLPGNVMLRSSLHETSDKMRYSYVQDGEIFDISDIVEEEQRGGRMPPGANKRDWLEGVVARNNQEGLGDNLDRVLNRIKGNKPVVTQNGALASPGMVQDSQRSSTSSYSMGETEAEPPTVTVTVSVTEAPAVSSRAVTPSAGARAASATPTEREKIGSKPGSRKQPSVGSVLSEDSSNETSSPSTPATTTTNHQARSNTPRRGPLIVKDDFGVSDMMAIIELGAACKKPPAPPPMDHVDEMLFGSKVNLEELHPRVREMFESTFKQLDDMDRQLDRALAATTHPV